jgi:hypothetical protein
MAIWFMRLSATICVATIVGVLGLVGRNWYQDASQEVAFHEARQHVKDLGGTLTTDLGEDNYVITLRGDVSDAQIEQLIGVLQPVSLRSRWVQPRFAFDLAGTQVGDEGVLAISTLPVTWLNLNGTHVTDQRLLHLRNQPRMSMLIVNGTKVTKPALSEMEVLMPQLWIPRPERRIKPP